jgi:hypothetical protein
MSPDVRHHDGERLVVSPRGACLMLGIGITHLYQLITARELDTYLDGRSRKITVDSIHRRIARLLAASGHPSQSPRRKRGRPPKIPALQQPSCPR